MAAEPITFENIQDYDDSLFIYCILVTGFDETNTGIIESAIHLFDPSEEEHIRLSHLLNSLQVNLTRGSNDIPLTEFPWHIKYLALFCFVYATLDASAMRARGNNNIKGLRMTRDVAPGWVYCLQKYLLDNTNVPRRLGLGNREMPIYVSRTNDIIATALTNQYIINNSVRFRRIFPHGLLQELPNDTDPASDIMVVASKTLNKLVTDVDASQEDFFVRGNPPTTFNELREIFIKYLELPAIMELFPNRGGARRKQSKRRKRKY